MPRRDCAIFPRGYLPMDCPSCGRRRLEYGLNDDGDVIYVKCEKCGANSDDETLWSPRFGLAPSNTLLEDWLEINRRNARR
jgi:hypothetical protein